MRRRRRGCGGGGDLNSGEGERSRISSLFDPRKVGGILTGSRDVGVGKGVPRLCGRSRFPLRDDFDRRREGETMLDAHVATNLRF